MQIIIAKGAGFCFGVKRAIDISFRLAKEEGEGIYTYGPLIHNPQVVEELRKQHVRTTENLESPNIKTLIIRTHGVSPRVYSKIEEEGYNLVDTTCPFVKKAQNFAKILTEEGYQVVIIGDRDHPEVRGLLGFAGDDALVVNNAQHLPPLKKKVGIIVQTTQSSETFRKIVLEVASRAREVKIYNTICDSTSQRARETEALASKVDLIIIVGGKNSSNTNQLVKLSRTVCAKVYHIETADELEQAWFTGVHKAGVTGGASTPQWIIDDVVEKMREISVGR
jgi:4-hydroxy-3-methylbut-2-enyl diphosphate reductase